MKTKNINKKFTRLKNHFLLPRFLREMRRLKIGGLSGGNTVKLIADGDEFFDRILKAISQAKKSINLETYIFNSDHVGWAVAEKLAESAKRGIEVNVIYDSFGSITTSSKLFSFLRESGVEVIEYHPFVPWKRYWNITFRDHRKILVVDGEIGFVGGINIGKEYAGRAFKGDNWRDTHLQIEGRAVRDIQFFFIENWYRHGGAILDNDYHFPELRKKGKKILMVLSSKSRKKIKPVQESYISAINNARYSISITNAYFIPDARIYRALVRAASRGVNVSLILPGKSDIPPVKYASRYLYKRYLKHGIRVFEYSRSILHAKTAVIDGIWSTVGSSNLDRISFRKNLEINVVVLDQEFGLKMESLFVKDLKKSAEITLDIFQKRLFIEFMLEWLCYRFRNLL
ncbi:MAG: cardiolipin synthase [bacterium]|nr:cardiolipin synthase [bacterium]